MDSEASSDGQQGCDGARVRFEDEEPANQPQVRGAGHAEEVVNLLLGQCPCVILKGHQAPHFPECGLEKNGVGGLKWCRPHGLRPREKAARASSGQLTAGLVRARPGEGEAAEAGFVPVG